MEILKFANQVKMLKYLKCFSIVNSRSLSSVLRKQYSTNGFQPFYTNFFQKSDNIAVIDNFGVHKYRDILYSSYLIAKRIESLVPSSFKTCERISFLCPSQSTYVAILLACWISGNIAVPLCSQHPEALLEYHIADSQSNVVIASESYASSIQSIATKLNVNYFTVGDSIVREYTDSLSSLEQSEFFSWDSDYEKRNALLIYTSGTTGRPKGVVLTHGNLYHQVSSVNEAWEITSEDSILHTLPLHHIHGIMNALLCLLKAGGTVVMRPKYNAAEVWSYLVNENNSKPKVNLYFAVPTMYVKLIEEYRNISENADFIKKSCEKNLRFMASGSAALLEPVFHKMKDITGHYLLERFGMSEIGMALANPLKGPRVPGAVGNPLPGVEVKIVEDPDCTDSPALVEGTDSYIKILPNSEGKSGDLLVRGPMIFKGYWNRDDATAEAFTKDGWFKTGDTATYSDGTFRILGRNSVDIIKSGGFKISALHVESCLLLHTNISDCAVIGIPDEVWGERVAALLVTKDKKEIPESELKAFCKKHLPSYSVPSIIKYLSVIPRNVTGKMNKKELKKTYF